MKNKFSIIFQYFIIGLIGYGFLVFCNVNFNPLNWNGFSRVIFAIGFLILIGNFFDEIIK